MQKNYQESLENKEYKWSHSTNRDFFIGMKLTLALETKTLKLLAFLINEANISEPKIYPEILKELKRKRITKAGDIIYAEGGYYSYDNYVMSVKDSRRRIRDHNRQKQTMRLVRPPPPEKSHCP
jgi:hypothetical protein